MPFLPTAAPDVLVVGDSRTFSPGSFCASRGRPSWYRKIVLDSRSIGKLSTTGRCCLPRPRGHVAGDRGGRGLRLCRRLLVNLAHSAPKSLLVEVPSRVRPGGVVWLYSVAHADRRPMIDGLGDEALMASFERSGLVLRAHLLVRRETSPPPFLDAITVLERR